PGGVDRSEGTTVPGPRGGPAATTHPPAHLRSGAMARISTRITDLLGIDVPIIQAPMGWIARSQLASAVSEAGGLGIIETSSGELDNVKAEIAKMRDLTDKPFGVNIAQAFVRDPGI